MHDGGRWMLEKLKVNKGKDGRHMKFFLIKKEAWGSWL